MSGRYGWCDRCTDERTGQYHNLCRIEVTSTFGVCTRCTCPHHEHPEGGE